jgi:AraC-like DNA-binding protein
MSLWQSFLAVFCGLSLVQSLFLGTILILKDRFNFKAFFYLGILLFGLAFRLAKSYFIFIPQPYPHWGVVTGGAGLWMIGPAFYFYTLHSIDIQRKSSVFNLVHFVPTLFILFTGFTDYVYYVGLAQLAGYFLFSFYLAREAGPERIPKHFRVFAFSVGIILLCFMIQAAGRGIEVYTIGVGIAIGILYVINYFIVKDSYFFQSIIKKPKAVDKQRAEKIITDLEKVFAEHKLYKNNGLTIALVAQKIDCPAYLISQAIYQKQGVRFNEFVNKFRVQDAMERLQRDNDKIEVIAREVGFSSMSSLYEAFKKETQLTPQAYRNRNELSRSLHV